jgi:hypothetical protein
LVVTGLLAGAVVLGASLAVSALSATAAHGSTPTTVSFYHQSKLLGSTAVAGGLDVVWKTPACSNGYGSPPAAFTWTDTSTGLASAPVIGPCGHTPGTASFIGADDFRCEFWPWYAETRCFWTYKKGSGSTTSSLRVANPGKATVGNVYLFKRTALYAYLVAPGKPDKKISVPAGTDTIRFAQGS